MMIPYVNLKKQYLDERKVLLPIIDKILQSGEYVGGREIEKFEKKIANFLNVKFCAALNSGTDALLLGIHSLGIKRDDEVITTPNSYIASTSTIAHVGAKPVFVDVLEDQNINPDLIENAITKKTKAIMAVHLTGRSCKMDKIIELSKKYNIPIIEDAAQSIGTKYKNKLTGTFGKIGCFSTHPLKNLNALGDGGFLVTNSKSIYEKVKLLSNHGMKSRNKFDTFGNVSRMDNVQAGILNYRFEKLNTIIRKRRNNAKLYFKNIKSKNVLLPLEKDNEFNTYHTFVIQTKKRNLLQNFLKKNGVQTAIHYPIPIHLQKASKYLGHKKNSFKKTEKQSKEILTLPINEYLTKKEIIYISNLINNFFKS